MQIERLTLEDVDHSSAIIKLVLLSINDMMELLVGARPHAHLIGY